MSQTVPEKLGIRHDVVNEQVLLAAAIVDPESRALTRRVPSDYFFGKGHAAAWEAITEMVRRNLEFSWDTLRQVGDAKVDIEYLKSIVADRPGPPPNIRHHLGMLEWDRTRIESSRGPLLELIKGIKDPRTSPERIRALAKSLGGALDHKGGARRYLKDPQELQREVEVNLLARKDGIACFPYGFKGLDFNEAGTPQMIPGAAPGKMTGVFGVPGGGKSTFACRMALNLAGFGPYGDAPRRGLICAWEMGDADTIELMAIQKLGWSRSKFATGNFTQEEMSTLLKTTDEINARVRFVLMPFGKARGSKRSVTNDERLDVIHGLIEDTAADWVIFDLWERALKSTKPDDVQNALYRQQAILEETKCHGILLHQLKHKEVEAREDKRPTREAVHGSGAWTAVMDTMLGIHRPSLFSGCDDITSEVIVMKQRFGRWPFTVEFDWDGDKGSFDNGREIDYDAPNIEKPNKKKKKEGADYDGFL